MIQASNDFLLYKVLEQKYQGSKIVEHAIAQGQDDLPLRQMCAKVHPNLIERLEHVCGRLEVSKRRFIETAVGHAIHEAENLIDSELEDLA